ncbi:fungal-specific transcription factor domain-containing protein [Boletus edulis BED1]|uniref:Fungal-specific transcription factor domain-containing protein n=1 Tax=Boletus edulis BED1 TaxID=1328754 RepID=A0AAD4C4N7_BOLED|nr:fungal-specific transcription factor domain-containing protein [Boletus edulis BED1]
MPPEPTKGKLKRKASRKEVEEYRFDGGHAREIEQKRNNGQISCAECRRLKIKCDKQIPCQSCQRRGCAALCPNGSLSTGQGTRFVLAATEHLHRRIAKMSERIRQLEDALSGLQSQHSTEPHPLLREDLLGVSHQDDEPFTPPDESGAPGHSPEVLDTFGTLSITDHGISRFFGPTGGTESDNMGQQDRAGSSTPDSARNIEPPPLLQDLRMFSQAFPFSPMGPAGAVRELIEGHLPNWERASYLAQTYCEQAGWLFRGVSKDQIMDELLPIYYSNGPPKATDENKSCHELALLFLVFAIGALVDLTQDPGNAEAEHYHQIARAAICLQPVLEKPSLVTIQALHLLSIYNAMSGNELSGKETSMETTWSLIVLAAHLAQTVYRDSTRWGLPDKIVQRRRILFWDLFVADSWHSLDTGRPPSFSRAYVDCRFPQSENTNEKNETDPGVAFETWTYRFASECVAEVAARTLTAEIPSYATIMELDRKVREFPIPEDAAHAVSSVAAPVSTIPTDDISIPEAMGRFVMAHAREVILLHIHRSFFAQAIIESPVNPLKSQYAPSFLATYRASSTILRTIRAQYAGWPHLCARFWSTWQYGFSAAIVFGTIVTRGPRSPLASNAIKELDEACVLFTKVAMHSRRAAKALPILTKLSEKAHNALAASQNEKPIDQLGQQWTVKEEGDGDDDELAIFAGRTRFVSTRRLPKSKQAPEGIRGIGFMPYPDNFPEPSVPQLYRAEGSTSSADRWAHTEQGQLHFPARHTDYTHPGVQPQVPSQWRPPRRSHYPYAPQHQPSSLAPVSQPQSAPQHSTRETVTTPSYSWAQQTSNFSAQFGSATYPAANRPESHGYPSHHPHAYELTSAPPYQQPRAQPSQPPHTHLPSQSAAPSELTELGLVSQESRLDERWTSFMRDSGYFEGFGYRSR